MAAPIEMSFGLRTRLGQWNHLLDRSRFRHVKGYITELAVEALCIVQPARSIKSGDPS